MYSIGSYKDLSQLHQLLAPCHLSVSKSSTMTILTYKADIFITKKADVSLPRNKNLVTIPLNLVHLPFNDVFNRQVSYLNWWSQTWKCELLFLD